MKLKSETDNSETTVCDECESEFCRATSAMNCLCPECAAVLYGYEVCEHEFSNGKCLKCYWDGSTSPYVKNLKSAKL